MVGTRLRRLAHPTTSPLLPMRERRLGAGDELEQTSAPFFGLPPRALKGAGDLARVLDALAPATQFARQCRVIAAEIARLELLVAELHVREFDRHGGVV